MSPVAFRLLVLASIALQVGSGFADMLLPSLIPTALSQAAEAEPLPAVFDRWWFVVSVVAWVPALLSGTIGLIFFKRWGRSLSLWTTVAGFGFYGLFGPGVYSGLAAALTEGASMLWGCLLYTSPSPRD